MPTFPVYAMRTLNSVIDVRLKYLTILCVFLYKQSSLSQQYSNFILFLACECLLSVNLLYFIMLSELFFEIYKQWPSLELKQTYIMYLTIS